MSDTESTKIKILNAAFALYGQNLGRKISLSSIAKTVGISKTAIYRHFESKEALEQEMHDIFYNDVCDFLYSIQHKTDENPEYDMLSDIIIYLCGKRNEIFYFMSTVPDFNSSDLYLRFKNKGIRFLDDAFNPDGSVKDAYLYNRALFIGASMLVFIVCRFKVMECAPDRVKDSAFFAQSLVNLLKCGLRLDAQSITLTQMSLIDEKCRKLVADIPEVPRILQAIAAVIKQDGLPNVTVESVANQLGMAKSSLYCWFDNKAEMLHTLAKDEMCQLGKIILQNISEEDNIVKKVYAMMETILLYFIKHRQCFPVFKWMQFQHLADGESSSFGAGMNAKFSNFFSKIDFFKDFDLGISIKDSALIDSWIFSIPVILITSSWMNDYSEAVMQASLKDIFFMLIKGIC